MKKPISAENRSKPVINENTMSMIINADAKTRYPNHCFLKSILILLIIFIKNLEFFENIEDFEYGQFLITKNPFAFSWDSKEQDFLFLEENLLSLDSFFSEMRKEKKKQFFEFLENCLTKNTVPRRDHICLDDCRSYVIQNEVKDLRIFRKA